MVEDVIIYTPMYVTLFWSVVLLISNRRSNRARFFLGIFMFTAFLLYLSHAHFFKRAVSVIQYYEPLYLFASLSVYPLYYWYIKLLTIETGFNRNNLLLLLPAFLFGSSSFLIYQFMDEVEKQTYFNKYFVEKEEDFHLSINMIAQKTIFSASRVIFLIQVLYLLFNGRKLIITYQDKISNFYSNLENRSVLWANYLLYAIVASAIMSILFNFLGRSFFLELPVLLIIPSILFSVLLFLIGYLGYLQNYTVTDMKRDELAIEEPILKNENSTRLKTQLIALYENEKIHLNPDLKITHVADKLHSNRTYISKLINTEFKCTFSEFVNRYRIKEAKQLLNDPSTNNYSLDYIAEKSGFGSMVNFMRVFRENEGMTPGRFRENNR